MEVKSNLELMTSIGSDHADPERKSLDHIIHKFDSTILVMFCIDLHSPNTGCIIDGCVLISLHRLSGGIF